MRRTAIGAFDEIQVCRIHRRIPHPHPHLMPLRRRERAFMKLQNFRWITGAVELKKLRHGAGDYVGERIEAIVSAQ